MATFARFAPDPTSRPRKMALRAPGSLVTAPASSSCSAASSSVRYVARRHRGDLRRRVVVWAEPPPSGGGSDNTAAKVDKVIEVRLPSCSAERRSPEARGTNHRHQSARQARIQARSRELPPRSSSWTRHVHDTQELKKTGMTAAKAKQILNTWTQVSASAARPGRSNGGSSRRRSPTSARPSAAAHARVCPPCQWRRLASRTPSSCASCWCKRAWRPSPPWERRCDT